MTLNEDDLIVNYIISHDRLMDTTFVGEEMYWYYNIYSLLTLIYVNIRFKYIVFYRESKVRMIVVRSQMISGDYTLFISLTKRHIWTDVNC